MSQKILILGGTGAMGVYLVPELLHMGYQVHVISLDEKKSDHPHLVYTKADAMDDGVLYGLLQNGYDAVVDFMLYHSTEKFKNRHAMLLENTGHYLYLSSYRVYADKDPVITEGSPRLLDVSKDRKFVSSNDYAMFKARQEDVLKQSYFQNWTILRPAVTFSKRRYQLVTLEANTLIYRAFHNKPIVLPKEAMPVQGTMTWSGDVAKMISRLVCNPKAYQECFTVATAEHHTWEEIAGFYQELCGLKYVTVDTETYLRAVSLEEVDWGVRRQLMYDRLFDRVIDNRKILAVTGLKQSEFMPVKDALRLELQNLPHDTVWPDTVVNEKMDALLNV